MIASGGDDESGSGLRTLKALRLIRMSKMLRIARLKRLLEKYQETLAMSQTLTMLGTVIVILFAIHLLACFWYMVGLEDEVIDNGVVIPGWVSLQPWNVTEPDQVCPTPDGEVCREVKTGTRYLTVMFATAMFVASIFVTEGHRCFRYLTAMYLALNALENGSTGDEKLQAVIGELVLGFIYGALGDCPYSHSPSRLPLRSR
jgi:hypothetical protein|eukprot:COSAG06_NODE_1641_length_8829_cov_23.966667_6_plen_202_part_00